MSAPLAHVGGGTLEPLQLAGLAALTAAYAMRARTLARRGRPVPKWRLACFASGVALTAASLASPLAHLGEELMLAHMAQHLVLGDLAALLIVLGLTGPLLQPLLAIGAIDRLRVLTHPLVAFPLWTASLYIWHIPALYQGALSSEPLHALQHACFIGFGVVMWMPLVGPLPVPQWFGAGGRLAYTAAVRLAGAGLGNFLMWSGKVLYPDYAGGEAFWDISPLTDQGIAGVIMTAEGGLVTLGVLTWLFLRWAQQDTERQRLLDLAESRGVRLDPERAGRAVAAGQGARLEERLREGGT
jgi:cytochrome c oxidase assembly factor CtaG